MKLWLDGLGKYLGDKLDALPLAVSGAIKSSVDGMKAALIEAITKNSREQSRVMGEAMSVFKSQASSMGKAAEEIKKAVSGIEVEVKASLDSEEISAKIDTTKLEQGIQILSNGIGKMSESVADMGAQFEKMSTAFGKSLEKRSNIVKLDDDQVRKLTGAMRGSSVGGVGGAVSSTRPGFRTGRKTIGISAAQLVDEDIITEKGVLITAATGNSGVIYVGDRSTVTADGDDDTDGFPLVAGASITVPVTNAKHIYVIGSAASQKLWWTAT